MIADYTNFDKPKLACISHRFYTESKYFNSPIFDFGVQSGVLICASLTAPGPRRFAQGAFRPYRPTASFFFKPILNTHLAKK